MLVLRTNLEGNASFRILLDRISRQMRKDIDHQDVSFNDVAEKLNGVGWEIHDNGPYQVERTGEWYFSKQLAWTVNDERLPVVADPTSQ